MDLYRALRLDPSPASFPVISVVGAGGKTTALLQLAHDLVDHSHETVYLTATTHLGIWQTNLVDHHIIATDIDILEDLPTQGITLITGEIEGGRTEPINQTFLDWLHENARMHHIPLLIEADGSRQKPLKAPAAFEPPIPDFTDIVVAIAGLGAIQYPLTNELVHRTEIFSRLSELQIHQPITPEALIRVLAHPQGGLKNIPSHSRRVVLLNQADTPELLSIGGSMVNALLEHYDSVIVGTLHQNKLQTFERCAGIVLAAGESSRFGEPKQLLDWKGKPFVRHVAETALKAGLRPVEVVTGFHAAEVESALNGLPVNLIHNLEYQQGQSTSIHAGVESLPPNVGSAVFLLADQPQIPVDIIQALIESHVEKLQPILAPLVLEEKRANPVLFDRVTFPDLLGLSGDVGGRAIFDKYRVDYLPWHDDILLFDVDKPEDYQRLKEME